MRSIFEADDMRTANRRQKMNAEERLKNLGPLLSEVERRAEKMGIDDNGLEFTVTIDAEMWEKIKDSI